MAAFNGGSPERCIMSIGHIMLVFTQDVNGILSLGQNAVQCLHGLDENAGRRMRRVRASLDTGDREPAKLPLEEVSYNALGQRRC
jgi:hypothetical protein